MLICDRRGCSASSPPEHDPGVRVEGWVREVTQCRPGRHVRAEPSSGSEAAAAPALVVNQSEGAVGASVRLT